MESLGCGIHKCCHDCASKALRTQVRSGVTPRCFEPNCKHPSVEPLVAKRLLSAEDFELYLRLALWSNSHVEACPLCCVLLYRESVPHGPSNVRCPSCSRHFCDGCRCAAHNGISCEEALLRNEEQASWQHSFGHRSSASTASDYGDRSSSTLSQPTLPDGLAANRVRICPRCRAMVEKADEEACDHVTCIGCRHEFCWSCLADRKVIYAHGNHHHRPSCPFFAPYSGKDDYLPEMCGRCRVRGTACRAVGSDNGGGSLTISAESVGVIFVSLAAEVSEAAHRWTAGLPELPRLGLPGCSCGLGSCSNPPRVKRIDHS